MIHKLKDGYFTISSHNVWRPGVYKDQRTALFANTFNDTDLQSLQTKKNQYNEVITYQDLEGIK